jgi:hypothetical protein
MSNIKLESNTAEAMLDLNLSDETCKERLLQKVIAHFLILPKLFDLILLMA